MMLSAQVRHISFVAEQIEHLDREIEARMRAFEQAPEAVDEQTGVSTQRRIGL